MSQWAGKVGLAVALVLLAVAGPKAATVDLAVPGRANTTPSIAADEETVVIAWGATVEGGATDVYAAVSRDAGRTFAPPVRVNDTNSDARLSGEQPPRVAVQRDAITIVWTTKGLRGTVLKGARSTDGGKSYARSAIVPGSDAAGNRGWHAVTVDAHGQVNVVWLDHREMAENAAVATTHYEHGAGKPDGVAMAQKSKLYVASLGGAVSPRAITAGVCYCCKTAFATGRNGELFAAWRHVYPGNLRDIAFTASRDGGGSFSPIARVSKDDWMLEGCPDDGPAMVVDAANRIHIVWPTLVTDTAGGDPTIALFYASSVDGKTFTARERIPTEGMPHHPTLASGGDGSLVAAWDEVANGKRRAAIGRATPDRSGHASFSRTIVSGADAALYPVIASAGGAAVVAWTNGTGSATTIRVARMP
jgi:hypothetical protein